MYAIDLFENTNPTDQIPVAPHVPGDKNRQVGNANLSALISALNNPENPSVSLQFLDGSREVLTPAQIDLIIYYYNKVLKTKVQKVNFLYRTLISRNKLFTLLDQLEEKKALAQAGQKSFSFAPDPVNPDEVTPQQLELFKEEKKSSKYKDVAVQRAMRQAQADFPTAASDAEAFAKSMMVQQDQDKKNIDRLKSASQRNQELINKNDELDQTQARSIDAIQQEIDKVEKDNNSLASMVQQMSRANAELQDKLARMRGRTPAEPVAVAAPEPQLGVSVATDKEAPAEPEAPSSPIDIGARQKIDQVSKAVVGQLLSLQNKEAQRGLTPAEQERLEKLEAQVAKLSKQVKRSDFGQIPGELVRAQNDPYVRGVANANFHEDLTHGLEEGSVFGQQDFDTQMDLAKLKTKLTQPKPAQGAPVAEPQPVPARLSDLQSRREKFANLADIKQEIERLQARATRGGRILPRGLAADLEDYFTTADVDRDYEEMLAKYQKQLGALQQYLGMRKVLWSPKKETHEMRASELHESKQEVWTVHFTDGTAVRVRVSDETDPAAVRKHYANKGKTVAKFDYGYGAEPEAGSGPEAHEPGSDRAISARTRDPLPEDTKSEFKAAALNKIKKALSNPKLDPDTRKDYESRLKKIQDLEEAKWKKETPWVKSTGKDPRGEVTHMSDVARKETERREREDSPMGQLFKDFEKVFGKKPPVKEGDVVNINRGGYNQFRDKNDFLDKRDYIQQQLLDPRQRDNHAELKQRLQDINYAGRKLGYI